MNAKSLDKEGDNAAKVATGAATPYRQVVLGRCPDLELKLDTPKGRGVFATAPIPSGTTIDTCPVLILSTKDNDHISQTSLYHYSYNWPVRQPNGSTLTQQAIIFGLGSMFNHSTQGQNVLWTRDLAREVVVYTAGRDIAVGEELCISYGSNLWFKDADTWARTPPETESKMLAGYDALYDTSLDGE